MSKKTIVATSVLFVMSAVAECQQVPAFEVASIKPSAPGLTGSGGHIRAGKIYYENTSLKELIETAYQVKDYQISGPDWLGSRRFDIMATMPTNTTREQGALMLQ